MTAVPHPVPYQGSKRKLAPLILGHFPSSVTTLVEPFCGSAALSLAAATIHPHLKFRLNDSLTPLAQLWNQIIESPDVLAADYEKLWHAQLHDPARHYLDIRSAFNTEHSPPKLLFLLARCVKNAVRFNLQGQFNQSPDHRRRGTHPDKMRRNLAGASALLRRRTQVTSRDFGAALDGVDSSHLVYLDPPYEGTSGTKNRRYHQGLDRHAFVCQLRDILSRGAHVIVSLDGRCGTKRYGTLLPDDLGLRRVEVDAGRSSQATLNGHNHSTIESLYISSGCPCSG